MRHPQCVLVILNLIQDPSYSTWMLKRVQHDVLGLMLKRVQHDVVLEAGA